jgi:hypothetical protein
MNLNAIKRNTEGLWDAGREVGLEITHKIKYIFMSHCQTEGQNNTKVANKSLRIVAEVKYLTAGVRNENFLHAAIKNKLNFGIVKGV